MNKKAKKSHLFLLSAMIAVFVAVINTLGALVAYQAFVPKRADTPAVGFIKASSGTAEQVTTVTPEEVPTPPVNTQVQIRANGKVKVGGKAIPSTVKTNADGSVTYKWCSGNNPNLEDGVCEAIASIAASPTADNPHISDRGKRSLGLMPKVNSITMDESSWQVTSDTSGTMLVTADTASYGAIKLQVTLNKIDGVWVVTDGKLA